MGKNQDWFRLLVEHTKRQSEIAHFQILVSFGLAGIVWYGKTSTVTGWSLFIIYLIFATYITFIIYRIQDRRLTLWRLIAINENVKDEVLNKRNKKDGGRVEAIKDLLKEIGESFRMLDSCYGITDSKEIQDRYVEKIMPSRKRVVFFLHVLANLCALSFILLNILRSPK